MRRLWNANEKTENQSNQSIQKRRRNNNSRRGKKVAQRTSSPSNVQEVTDIVSYKKVVCDESNSIVVVRFYAPWCAMCKAIQPFWYKLARSLNPEVKFVEVPCTADNAKLHQALGIPSLPYGHIYYPQQGGSCLLVEEASLNKKRFLFFPIRTTS